MDGDARVVPSICVGANVCMRIKLQNCFLVPIEYLRYLRKGKLAAIVLRSECDCVLFIWQWYVTGAGNNNNINAFMPML